MKYIEIIQDLIEAGDPMVKAFLKDAGRIKRLSKKERDYFLQNRRKPGAVTKLVEEFIPFIIMVAYGYSQKAKMLSVLDLINEGVLGAYVAFERTKKGEILTKRRVISSIKSMIKKTVYKEYHRRKKEYKYYILTT